MTTPITHNFPNGSAHSQSFGDEPRISEGRAGFPEFLNANEST